MMDIDITVESDSQPNDDNISIRQLDSLLAHIQIGGQHRFFHSYFQSTGRR